MRNFLCLFRLAFVGIIIVAVCCAIMVWPIVAFLAGAPAWVLLALLISLPLGMSVGVEIAVRWEERC
jgi:hypothetical protein